METRYVKFDIVVSVDIENENVTSDEIIKLASEKVRTECDVEENCVGIFKNPDCTEEDVIITLSEPIVFNGKEFKTRKVHTPGGYWIVVAEHALLDELFDDRDNYVSDEAERIDDEIGYFAYPLEFELSDKQLEKTIAREVYGNYNTHGFTKQKNN